MERISFGGLRCRLPIQVPGHEGRIVTYCMASFNHVGPCNKNGNGLEPTKPVRKPEKLKEEDELK